MNIEIEHLIPSSVEALENKLLDIDTWKSVAGNIPAIKKVSVSSKQVSEESIVLRKRFVPNMEIPSYASKKVTQEMLEWDELLIWNKQMHSGGFEIKPNIPEEWKKYFCCDGLYHLIPSGESTIRKVKIRLNFNIPLLGSVVEKLAARTIKEWYEYEARFLSTI